MKFSCLNSLLFNLSNFCWRPSLQSMLNIEIYLETFFSLFYNISKILETNNLFLSYFNGKYYFPNIITFIWKLIWKYLLEINRKILKTDLTYSADWLGSQYGKSTAISLTSNSVGNFELQFCRNFGRPTLQQFWLFNFAEISKSIHYKQYSCKCKILYVNVTIWYKYMFSIMMSLQSLKIVRFWHFYNQVCL